LPPHLRFSPVSCSLTSTSPNPVPNQHR
jgi:hypothetical protein